MEQLLNKKLIIKMVGKGLLQEKDMEVLLALGDKHKEVIYFDLIIQKKLLSEEEVFNFLKEEYGYPIVDPTSFTITSDVLNLIEKEVAQQKQILPLFKIDNTLTVAISNPMSVVGLDDLRLKLRLKLDVMLSLPSKLEEAIEVNYSQSTHSELPQENIEELFDVVESEEDEFTSEDIAELMQKASETPVIKVANLLIGEAIKKKASDLFIEPWEKKVRIRCRVDGILEELKSPPKSIGNALVSRIKVMSQLNIAERRIPQDGRFKVKIKQREVDVRVSVIPSTYGEKVCLRLLDKSVNIPNLNKLGFVESELQQISDAITKPHGMILITGPTGSGKSTTLYAMLNMLHSPEKNITTVEDPVEYQMNGINQVNVNEGIDLTFSSALRSILRQDPDIIMIGEIRDAETLDIAIKAALTGHLVLTTLHTNDSISSLVRMTNMGIEPFLISSSVLMITAQRLVRKLCSQCREAYEPDLETVKRYELKQFKSELKLYKPIGCAFCSGKGYQGRTLLTEILKLSPEIRALILKGVSQDIIKKRAFVEGMKSLRKSGIYKALSGDTSLEEVIRVTAGDFIPD